MDTITADDVGRIGHFGATTQEKQGADRDVREDDGGGGSVAVGLRVNDFETVRNGLHYYGDTIPNDPEVMAEADAAIDRIEAKVEALAKTDFVAEVERLRERVNEQRDLKLQARAEVERLRESNQTWAKVANDLVESIGRDKVQALVHVKAYVERLRAALKACEELKGVDVDVLNRVLNRFEED